MDVGCGFGPGMWKVGRGTNGPGGEGSLVDRPGCGSRCQLVGHLYLKDQDLRAQIWDASL